MDLFYDLDGRRLLGRMPETLPRIGETMVMTRYGRVRPERWVVKGIDWILAQEEGAQHFNRPKTVVIRLVQEAGPGAGGADAGSGAGGADAGQGGET